MCCHYACKQWEEPQEIRHSNILIKLISCSTEGTYKVDCSGFHDTSFPAVPRAEDKVLSKSQPTVRKSLG